MSASCECFVCRYEPQIGDWVMFRGGEEGRAYMINAVSGTYVLLGAYLNEYHVSQITPLILNGKVAGRE